MAVKVLDSWALIALFEDEPAAEAVENILHRATLDRDRLLLTVVNWGEIYYSIMRATSQKEAEAVMEKTASLPIELVEADLELTKQAAIFKATKKLSYADAFAAALAKVKGAELVTGDPEFQEVEKEIKISWLK